MSRQQTDRCPRSEMGGGAITPYTANIPFHCFVDHIQTHMNPYSPAGTSFLVWRIGTWGDDTQARARWCSGVSGCSVTGESSAKGGEQSQGSRRHLGRGGSWDKPPQ